MLFNLPVLEGFIFPFTSLVNSEKFTICIFAKLLSTKSHQEDILIELHNYLLKNLDFKISGISSHFL